MMRFMDFSSWHGVLTTIGGLLLFTLVGVGIRVLMMLTIQQRQQRMNRQINERLRTLIAAYKVLGGSFTGTLSVDPGHMRDQRRRQAIELEEAHKAEVAEEAGVPEALVPPEPAAGPSETAAERARRVRDAVEAALADIILLGTEDHVRLAARAAGDMVAGTPIHTAELVTSLRNYIRNALDLGDIPSDVVIPSQGPTRPSSAGGGARGGRGSGGGEGGGGGGGSGAGGGGGGAGGGGMGMGVGLGLGRRQDDA